MSSCMSDEAKLIASGQKSAILSRTSAVKRAAVGSKTMLRKFHVLNAGSACKIDQHVSTSECMIGPSCKGSNRLSLAGFLEPL